MGAMIPWGKGPLTCAPGGELGFTAGEELKGLGQHGRADLFLLVKCDSTIVAADTASAFTATQQRAFMASHTLDVRLDGDPSTATLTTLDADNPFHPLQKARMDKVMQAARNLFEKDFPGYVDSSTGLAQSYTAGTKTLKWVGLVSFGQMEFISEDELIGGIGPDQLDRLSLTLRVNSDYPKSVDADLTYTGLKASFYAYRIEAPGRRIFLPPRLREYIPATTRQSVTTGRGVPLVIVDRKQPLSTYTKGQLTVDVGGQVVTRPPQTAQDIYDTYVLAPDVGAVEKSVADLVTPIYINSDLHLASLRAGPVTARQETLLEAWEVEEVALASPLAAQLIGYLMGCVKNLPAGSTVHYMSTPKLRGLTVPAGLLPAAGYTGFFDFEPEARQYPSVSIGTDGKVQVHIPQEEWLAPAVAKWADGKSQGGAQGEAKAQAAVEEIVEWMPGGLEDEVKGFPKPSGGGGSKTFIYSAVESRIVDLGTAELKRRAATR